jgi:hypothetical protein
MDYGRHFQENDVDTVIIQICQVPATMIGNSVLVVLAYGSTSNLFK